jgi:ATP/maltotriose-dependent transcriptional regulator MalT
VICPNCGTDIRASEEILTRREAQVASLIIRGASNQKISGILLISDKTVKYHATAIYKKLSLSSRAELIHGYYSKLLNAGSTALMEEYLRGYNEQYHK